MSESIRQALAIEAAGRAAAARHAADEEWHAAVRKGKALVKAGRDNGTAPLPRNGRHDVLPLIPLPPVPLAARQAAVRAALIRRRRAARSYRYGAGPALPRIPGHAYATTGHQILSDEAGQWARHADYAAGTRRVLRGQDCRETYGRGTAGNPPRVAGFYPAPPLPLAGRMEWQDAPAPARGKASRQVSLATARRRCEAAVAGLEAGKAHRDYCEAAVLARIEHYAGVLPLAEYDAYVDRVDAAQEAEYAGQCQAWLAAESEYLAALAAVAPVVVQACPAPGCTLAAGHVTGHLVPVGG